MADNKKRETKMSFSGNGRQKIVELQGSAIDTFLKNSSQSKA